MGLIRYFYEGVKFKIPEPRKTAKWIEGIIILEKKSLAYLNFIFCNDLYLNKINKTYLKHNTLTDVIAFQYSALNEPIEADIFISIPRIRENAKKFKTNFVTELHRVMVHGALHTLGYSDKNKANKSRMRDKEDLYLSLR